MTASLAAPFLAFGAALFLPAEAFFFPLLAAADFFFVAVGLRGAGLDAPQILWGTEVLGDANSQGGLLPGSLQVEQDGKALQLLDRQLACLFLECLNLDTKIMMMREWDNVPISHPQIH